MDAELISLVMTVAGEEEDKILALFVMSSAVCGNQMWGDGFVLEALTHAADWF